MTTLLGDYKVILLVIQGKLRHANPPAATICIHRVNVVQFTVQGKWPVRQILSRWM